MEPASTPSANSRVAATGSDAAWVRLIPDEQLDALELADDVLRARGIETLLGGAFALARHVGRWRGTKDVDFFLRPADREAAIQALLEAGFVDYYDQLAYDRSWIFRAHRPDGLIDLIWTLPNHAAEVDDGWFACGAPLELRGRSYRTIPAEELIWIKLFVLQRDRCDWPDVLNVLRTCGSRLDWRRLIGRTGENRPLLHAALTLLAWLSPAQMARLPHWVIEEFGLPSSSAVARRDEREKHRAGLLDSRPWFAALLPPDEPMAP